jgi:hypothetical protein
LEDLSPPARTTYVPADEARRRLGLPSEPADRIRRAAIGQAAAFLDDPAGDNLRHG